MLIRSFYMTINVHLSIPLRWYIVKNRSFEIKIFIYYFIYIFIFLYTVDLFGFLNTVQHHLRETNKHTLTLTVMYATVHIYARVSWKLGRAKICICMSRLFIYSFRHHQLNPFATPLTTTSTQLHHTLLKRLHNIT